MITIRRRNAPPPLTLDSLHAAWIAAFAPDFVGPWEPVRRMRNDRPVLQMLKTAKETVSCA